MNGAIICNNHAVELLQQGNNQSAMSSLSHALQIFQRELLSNQGASCPKDDLRCEGTRSTLHCRKISEGTTTTAVETERPCHIYLGERLEDMQDMMNYSIFNYPLLLSGEGHHFCRIQERPSPYSELEQEKESFLQATGASVIFNLALAYHLEGIVRINRACVKKALQLYDLAQELTCRAVAVVSEPTASFIALVYLAAVNNAIHCSLLEDGDNEAATQRLGELMSLVQHLPGLEPTLMNAIVVNALTTRHTKYLSASAA